MPTSHTGQINTIIELIEIIDPRSVLDIGIGNGKYGFLAREYLEIAKQKDSVAERTVRIDGVEAFPEYVTDLQKHIYDNIYIGNALDLIEKLDVKYDLILLVDVFEHFTQEDGYALLDNCLVKGKNILISSPKKVLDQGAEYGNIFETHRFEWKKKHFSRLTHKEFVNNYYSLIVLIGDKAHAIKKTWSQRRIKLRLAAKFPWLLKIYSLIK